MEASITNFLLLFAAVAVGWLLGRLGRSKPPQSGAPLDDSASYYKGLNFLLNEQADEAVLTVVNELPVRLETLPTHLALGNLMRSKGEVEAAIRIHQNLLSRPSLPREELHKVHLELARDYISAGLLDRAERLLRDLVEESPGYRNEALEHLRHIYQTEKEWEQAIAVAMRLLPKRGWLRRGGDKGPVATQVSLCHYHCEIVERLLHEGDLKGARRELAKAQQYEPGSLRLGLLSAQLSLQQGRSSEALSCLQDLLRSKPAWAMHILPMFKKAFAEVGGAESYMDALARLGSATDSSALAVELAGSIARLEGRDAGREYIRAVAMRRPTLRTLSCWLELSGDEVGPAAAQLREVIEEILATRSIYQCRQCGFSGRKLHWLCPSCEQWGTIAPIRGTQGD